ncbi:MAG: ABC transporter ATP-binding protein [Actinomycetota bacterium]|nr:ABC transporter ATP-binding protein [Actinomycetota bacterium]
MTATTAPAADPADLAEAGVQPATAIRTQGLTKRYGSRAAVDQLTIQVPTGVVAGFVGLNGAGKTTTIRMLLGLITPSDGTAEVLGQPISHPAAYLHQVGAMIEGPAFYPTLSARANLEVLATLGGHPKTRIGQLLELVGLADRAGDRYGSYSMGMKQRLGIAAALLPDPALLVLDEPANGLDPAGIIEVRDLLRRLADDGTTVFVSSHLLGEVEQISDWLVMIDHGRLLFDGPISEILERQHTELMVATEQPDDLTTVAKLAAEAGHYSTRSNGHLRIQAPASYAAELNRQAMAQGVTLVQLHPDQPSLEETFLSMTTQPEVQ